MKYLRGTAISLLLVSSASVLAQNNCMNLYGCEKKACEVNQELLIAKHMMTQGHLVLIMFLLLMVVI